MKFLFLFLFASLSAYELAITAQFRDEAPYLKEWIDYHRKMGVEHFWLYDNASVDEWREVLQPYIDEGVVEVFDWPSETFNFMEYHTMANRDALRRARGVAKWVALIDIDEFLLPMKEKSVTECLNTHFSEAPAIYASWRMFGTGGISLAPGESLLMNLTAASFKSHPRNAVGKSLLRPEWVDIDRIWYEHYMPLLPGSAGYYNGNGEKMDFDGSTLLSLTQHCDRYLRINHYNLRDETFFQNSRVRKAKAGIYGDLDLLMQHYEDFSRVKDLTMVRALQRKIGDGDGP